MVMQKSGALKAALIATLVVVLRARLTGVGVMAGSMVDGCAAQRVAWMGEYREAQRAE
jgi:hypothetical protein